MGTIRLKLFKVAARVVVTARRVVFHLSSSYPYQTIFRTVYANMMGRPPIVATESGSSAVNLDEVRLRRVGGQGESCASGRGARRPRRQRPPCSPSASAPPVVRICV